MGTTCEMITKKNAVSKIVKDKEAMALKEIESTGLLDHNYMNEIRICAQDMAWAGPYQIAAASIYLDTKSVVPHVLFLISLIGFSWTRQFSQSQFSQSELI